MEKQINELVAKIMNSKNLDSNNINELIELHKAIRDTKLTSNNESGLFEKQIKRLEMTLRDKLKQINFFLGDDYLDILEDILFYRNAYRDGKADIKDIRLIDKNGIAIIRENLIQLGYSFYDADKLRAGMRLMEEANFLEYIETGKEPEGCDPKKIFSCFYEEMNNKIKSLKETLNIADRDVIMYFDKDLDSFYFDNPNKSFKAILTELPNTIEIYEIDATQDNWIPKKINGNLVKDYMDRINFTLLEEDSFITDLKQRYKGILFYDNINDFDIEILLEKFKKTPFSLDLLINTYKNLFNDNNCMSKENKSAINRLKHITVERYVEQGFKYEKALNYVETIFQTIEEYKKQIVNAISGENKFPESSLIGVIKKLKIPMK